MRPMNSIESMICLFRLATLPDTSNGSFNAHLIFLGAFRTDD